MNLPDTRDPVMLMAGYDNHDFLQQALAFRTKPTALHVENHVRIVEDSEGRPVKRQRSIGPKKEHLRPPVVSERAIDTPLDNTPISNRSQSTSLHSKQTSLEPIGVVQYYGKSDTARPLCASSDHEQPPSPIKNYPPEPKLWVDDGPEAGKETSDWRRKFVPLFHTAYGSMTTTERTQIFDQLVEKDQGRYTVAIATYYAVYPETLPGDDIRQPSANAQIRIDRGFQDGLELRRQQQRVFHGWNWDPTQPPVSTELSLGPRDETSPAEQAPECPHCVKEAKKERLRKAARPVVAPVFVPIRKLRRAISTRLAPSPVMPESEDRMRVAEDASRVSGVNGGNERSTRSRGCDSSGRECAAPRIRTMAMQQT